MQAAVPKKSDEEDVLDLVQKLDREEAEEDQERSAQEKEEDRFQNTEDDNKFNAQPIKERIEAQRQKEIASNKVAKSAPVSKPLSNAALQPSLYSKKAKVVDVAAVKVTKA